MGWGVALMWADAERDPRFERIHVRDAGHRDELYRRLLAEGVGPAAAGHLLERVMRQELWVGTVEGQLHFAAVPGTR